jgi:hypothetical protein
MASRDYSVLSDDWCDEAEVAEKPQEPRVDATVRQDGVPFKKPEHEEIRAKKPQASAEQKPKSTVKLPKSQDPAVQEVKAAATCAIDGIAKVLRTVLTWLSITEIFKIVPWRRLCDGARAMIRRSIHFGNSAVVFLAKDIDVATLKGFFNEKRELNSHFAFNLETHAPVVEETFVRLPDAVSSVIVTLLCSESDFLKDVLNDFSESFLDCKKFVQVENFYDITYQNQCICFEFALNQVGEAFGSPFTILNLNNFDSLQSEVDATGCNSVAAINLSKDAAFAVRDLAKDADISAYIKTVVYRNQDGFPFYWCIIGHDDLQVIQDLLNLIRTTYKIQIGCHSSVSRCMSPGHFVVGGFKKFGPNGYELNRRIPIAAPVRVLPTEIVKVPEQTVPVADCSASFPSLPVQTEQMLDEPSAVLIAHLLSELNRFAPAVATAFKLKLEKGANPSSVAAKMRTLIETHKATIAKALLDDDE